MRAARAATDAVDVLLQLARALSPGQWDVVDIAAITAAEVRRAAPLVQHKSVQLFYADSTAVTVRAPSALCQAAIGYLIRAACDITAEGSVAVHRGGGRVVVEDTGPGLPAAMEAALHASKMPESSGSAWTGFGQGIVQRICEYLHWDRDGQRPAGRRDDVYHRFRPGLMRIGYAGTWPAIEFHSSYYGLHRGAAYYRSRTGRAGAAALQERVRAHY